MYLHQAHWQKDVPKPEELEGGDMMPLCMTFRHVARAMETLIEEIDLPLRDWY